MPVDVTARQAKKDREAKRLRGVPPQDTLAIGFDLVRFGRRLQEAAEDARD